MNERHGSPLFYKLLDEMAQTHSDKSHDYADNSNPYGNYHFAGYVSSLFAHSPDDAGFAGRLAEKMYRLAILEGGRKLPKNESIDDTERDIAVIATLWMASRRQRRPIQQEVNPEYGMSEEAAKRIIEETSNLNGLHLQQMIDYLVEVQKANRRRDNERHSEQNYPE